MDHDKNARMHAMSVARNAHSIPNTNHMHTPVTGIGVLTVHTQKR